MYKPYLKFGEGEACAWQCKVISDLPSLVRNMESVTIRGAEDPNEPDPDILPSYIRTQNCDTSIALFCVFFYSI